MGRSVAQRPGLALVLALACVAAVCWVSSMQSEETVKTTQDHTIEEKALEQIYGQYHEEEKTHMDVIDKALDGINDMLVQNDKKVLPTLSGLAVKPGKVHENIVNLKAYCVAVHPQFDEMEDHLTSSVIPFVKAFGEDRNAKNVIVEYSQLFAKMSNEFKSGMGLYLLRHLNKAMLAGEGAVGMDAAVGNNAYVLMYETLGLESLPKYLKKMKVSIAAFSSAQDEIAKKNTNADAYAAAVFLRGKHNQAYTSFLDREMAKEDAKANGVWNSIKGAAYKAEVAAFSKSVDMNRNATKLHVKVQAPAGWKAAEDENDVLDYVAPTREELNARAEAEAKAFMDSLKDQESTTAAVVTNAQEEAMGVTVHVSTTQKESGESSMQPTITIKGTKGSLTGKLNALPQPSESISQHFPSDHPIGDITSITLEAEPGSMDPWMVDTVKAETGGKEVTMQQTLFWLEAEGTSNSPDHHEGFKYGHIWELTPKAADVTEAI